MISNLNFIEKKFLEGEGMDEMDFTEAESAMNDIYIEYDAAEHPWGATLDDDDGDDPNKNEIK
jgi:hypothetical protein